MATMILSSAGNALFGPVGGFLGAVAGQMLDASLQGMLAPTQTAPSRLSQLSVQSVADGSPMARVWGRVVVAGHVIWTGGFRERVNASRPGGKTGPKVETRSYSLSFAIGLCEGPINGIGRVWVNGALLDMATVAHRVMNGTPDQDPDPLVEAVIGLDGTPAWRDMAVLVFEDLPLDAYGDRIPVVQVEVFAAPGMQAHGHQSLEEAARAVCLIPGSGEFSLATTPVRRIAAPGRELGENLHASASRADLEIALDQLQRDLPAVTSVSLVVAWFGDDLRSGQCTIRPKVEAHDRRTAPLSWQAAGLSREQALLVSTVDGRPAYGGSPADASIIEAITALKARGLKVVLNPFVLMDIPPGNDLPDPMGATAQPAHPWRGRITCHPAPGRPDSPDGSPEADAQVAAFFGTAAASHYSVTSGAVHYTGPTEWRYNRFVLHLAALAQAAGGVDGFLLGSELVGLTRVAGGDGTSPAAEALRQLAGQARTLLGPAVKIGYGADWTEYGAQVPAGAPADVWFPLDRLWADPDIDFIGIDWYAPIADTGPGDLPPDFAELREGVTGGEGFDWFYASDAARAARTRTPITDGAFHEPWVYRQKDLKSWWSNPHHPRRGGVRAVAPTAWVPQSKPVWLMELGFPAVDRAANRPSVFPDPKSSESGLPPFSTGARDDGAQRLALEASLNAWRSGPGVNPVSGVYGGPMVDPDRIHLWCWDARPAPWFPGLPDVWTDAAHAMKGHWICGRAGVAPLAAIVSDLCAGAGVASDVSAVAGLVEGYVVQGPGRARDLLQPLAAAFGLHARSRDGRLVWRSVGPPVADLTIAAESLVHEAGQPLATATMNSAGIPDNLTLNALSPGPGGLETASLTVGSLAGTQGRGGVTRSLDLPAVLDRPTARELALRLLSHARLTGENLTASLAPAEALRVEPGDRVTLSSLDPRVWEVTRMEGLFPANVVLSPAGPRGHVPAAGVSLAGVVQASVAATPHLILLDLPAGLNPGTPPDLAVGLFGDPWGGPYSVRAGTGQPAVIASPATIGTLPAGLAAGPVGLTLPGRLDVELQGGSMPSSGRAALLLDGLVAEIIGWTGAQPCGA
jgi:hypothetical protein